MLIEIGHVESIFRYPVKSMAGERLEQMAVRVTKVKAAAIQFPRALLLHRNTFYPQGRQWPFAVQLFRHRRRSDRGLSHKPLLSAEQSRTGIGFH
jgi:MOSC N-terminal beta barrel domain